MVTLLTYEVSPYMLCRSQFLVFDPPRKLDSKLLASRLARGERQQQLGQPVGVPPVYILVAAGAPQPVARRE